MRKGLWRKVGIALCIVVLALIVGSVSVLAVAYTKDVPSDVNVVAGGGLEIKVCPDDVCNNTLTVIHWGNMGQGTTSTKTVYIKNLSGKSVDVSVSAEGLAAGTVSGGVLGIANGACVACVITLTINGAAPLGVDNFTTVFTASEASP